MLRTLKASRRLFWGVRVQHSEIRFRSLGFYRVLEELWGTINEVLQILRARRPGLGVRRIYRFEGLQTILRFH